MVRRRRRLPPPSDPPPVSRSGSADPDWDRPISSTAMSVPSPARSIAFTEIKSPPRLHIVSGGFSYGTLSGIICGVGIAIIVGVAILCWWQGRRRAHQLDDEGGDSDEVDWGSGGGGRRAAIPGLDARSIAAIPKVAYPPETMAGRNLETECPICLVELEQGEVISRLRCGHLFHTGCAEKALAVRSACPVCNDEVPRLQLPEP